MSVIAEPEPSPTSGCWSRTSGPASSAPTSRAARRRARGVRRRLVLPRSPSPVAGRASSARAARRRPPRRSPAGCSASPRPRTPPTRTSPTRVGELVNMIGGNVKSLMPGPSVLSLPVVAAGRVARRHRRRRGLPHRRAWAGHRPVSRARRRAPSRPTDPPEPMKETTMKILVADDSRVMRQIVIRTLRQAGYAGHDIVEAENGRQALELVRSRAPRPGALGLEHARDERHRPARRAALERRDGAVRLRHLRGLRRHARPGRGRPARCS